MKMETFKTARVRLFTELKACGFTTSSPTLKVLWVDLGYAYRDARLWFKPQAIYLNIHSLSSDIRGVSRDQLLHMAKERISHSP